MRTQRQAGLCMARVLALGLISFIASCGRQAPDTARGGSAGLTPREALGRVDSAGFAQADKARPFAFPQDHGPHPDFRTEWWYVTGNLQDDGGHRFGYQLTIFRSGLRSPESLRGIDRQSDWAASQIWLAHFAVTDVDGARMLGAERFARGALGLAGATASPFRVWLEDWELIAEDGGTPSEDGMFPLRLRAADGEGDERIEIDLSLSPDKPRVLQGEAGLSRKSATPGNASYYYSYTRIATQGRIQIGDSTTGPVAVRGSSWLDREWSTSALAQDQVGWDWFALHLDDGRDLMVYRLRLEDGSSDPASSGTLVSARAAADGTMRSRRLQRDDFELEPHEVFEHSSGARYPIRWTVQAAGLKLEVKAAVADQAHGQFVVPYWEGAVDVVGTDENGAALSGRGYLEMTGYGR